MSTYLATYLDLIPLGASIVQMQNTLVGNLTANGWQLLAQVDGLGGYSDLIPPATEPIGTSQFREVSRIYFPNNTTITLGSYQGCIADAFPQQFRLTALTGGAVQAGVTIGGVTVQGAVGSSGSTANDNLRSLYYALMDSADPTITGWTYTHNGTDTLIGTRATIAAAVAVTGANVTVAVQGIPVQAGAQSDWARVDRTHGYSVTTDLTNGFVYYMDVFSRSFSLSTKCLAGNTGPIFATYAEHAKALAVCPSSPYCTPIELLVGSRTAGGIGQVHTTHLWAVGTRYGNMAVANTGVATMLSNWNDTTAEWHPFSGAGAPNVFMDCTGAYAVSSYGYNLFDQYALLTGGIVGAGTAWDSVFKLETVGLPSFSMARPQQSSVRFFSRINLPDLYQWNGSEPNETAAMAVDLLATGTPTLQQALDATTAYTTFLLSDVTGLSPTGGGFIIGNEEFTYTGLSGNSPTGITRAANGTTATRHFVGHAVRPVTWFLKVGAAGVCCGPTKPV